VVYCIQNIVTKNVKVGHSDGPLDRLPELQVGNEARLEVIATMPGGVIEEAELHRRLGDRLMRGEWFRSDPAFLKRIKRLFERGLELNVWEECRLRNRCRYGLTGIAMRHTPSDRLFTCQGSEWGANDSLYVYETEGWYDPGFEPILDDLGCINLADIDLSHYHFARKLVAGECVLMEPWPVTCCPRRSEL
jgi:hypothetical protein